MSGLRDGTPIVCRNCGGGMELAADSSITCRYCGARDLLPPDELGRVLEIKNRLTLAQQRAASLRGVDGALASIFEDRGAFLRVSGLYFAVAALVFGSTLVSFANTVLPNVDKLPSGALLEMAASSALGPLLVLCIGLSFSVALWRGKGHYRKTVRPLLLARAPQIAGAACRCRACGGELPRAERADVRCVYCDTTNLIPKELHGAQAQALFDQAEAARQKLRALNVATISIARTMRRTLIVCGIITALIAYGVPALIQALV
ncbi:MAG TPA: hypothetical protein VGM29_12540 [Polyangiaceae bacterium]